MNRDVCEHFNPVDQPCAKCEEKRKSEALFLADELEIPLGTVIQSEVCRRAAKELRRLHAIVAAREDDIKTHSAAVYEATRLLAQAREQRGALLKALKKIAADHAYFSGETLSYARAAIAKAKEKP